MSDPASRSRALLNAIMLAVLIWGLLLALGVRVYRGSWLGAAIVAGCTVLFVGSWWLLLYMRETRENGERGPRGAQKRP